MTVHLTFWPRYSINSDGAKRAKFYVVTHLGDRSDEVTRFHRSIVIASGRGGAPKEGTSWSVIVLTKASAKVPLALAVRNDQAGPVRGATIVAEAVSVRHQRDEMTGG